MSTLTGSIIAAVLFCAFVAIGAKTYGSVSDYLWSRGYRCALNDLDSLLCQLAYVTFMLVMGFAGMLTCMRLICFLTGTPWVEGAE